MNHKLYGLLGDEEQKMKIVSTGAMPKLWQKYRKNYAAHSLVVLAMLIISGVGASIVAAQAGINITNGSQAGLIGANRNRTVVTTCPNGTFLRGMRHVDKSMSAPATETRGMTSQLSLYCQTITTDGNTVTTTNRNANGTPDVNGTGYAQPGISQDRYCPSGTVIHQLGGWDRSVGGWSPWASAVRMVCRPLIVNANDWIQVDTSGTATTVDAGNQESNGTHNLRGPYCSASNPDTMVSGYSEQAGSAGYDGIGVYCSTIQQARFSAAVVFDNFSWDQTRGGSGWLVDLTQSGTVLSNAQWSGANRTPHTAQADNPNTYQSASEIYVTPGNNYGATESQRPSSVPANTYVKSGSCGSGITLGNQEDTACTMTVEGRPDVGVSFTAPANDYTSYGQQQTATLTATNYGPGATKNDDGFTISATLPDGWTAGTLPTNCSANSSNTIVTCQLDPTPLAGSSAPGEAGGSQSFLIPITVNTPTDAGDYNVQVALGRDAPDNDDNPANNDFNTDNDTTTGTLSFVASSRLEITKEADRTSVTAADQQIHYTFTVKNSGNTTINNIKVTDGRVNDLSCPETTLAQTEEMECTASYTVTQADMDAGDNIDNIASVTGTPADSTDQIPPTSSNTVSIPVTQTPTMQIRKSSTKSSIPPVGEVIDYTFSVRNTGNVTLSNVQVNDPNVPSVSCPNNGPLAPGATLTCSAEHTVTQADIDDGEVTNTATASATAPDDTAVNATSNTIRITVDRVPALSIAKSSDRTSIDAAGQTINYSFNVRNTGNVTLTDVTVSDPRAENISCPRTTLAPGETMTCTANRTVSQADIDRGADLTNIASVTGTPPGDGAEPIEPTSSNQVAVEVEQNPDFTVTKTAGTPADTNDNGLVGDAGDQITYKFTVRNTGNVTLNNVTISDDKLGVSDVQCSDSLAPSASTNCPDQVYTITADDAAAGTVSNTATVSATPNTPGASRMSRSSNTVNSAATAEDGKLTITKSADKTEVTAAQEVINYTFVVKNTGNVTIDSIAVTDNNATDLSCPQTRLNPGQEMTCTAKYTVTQDDMNDGSNIENTASVAGKKLNGEDIPAVNSNTVEVEVVQAGSFELVKTAGAPADKNNNGTLGDAGDEITYTFTVKNTGTVTLTSVMMGDEKLGITDVECAATLQPGETANCPDATYTITQEDVDRGSVENTANGQATPPASFRGGVTLRRSSNTTSTTVQAPENPPANPTNPSNPQDPSRSNSGSDPNAPDTGVFKSPVTYIVVAVVTLVATCLALAIRRRQRLS